MPPIKLGFKIIYFGLIVEIIFSRSSKCIPINSSSKAISSGEYSHKKAMFSHCFVLIGCSENNQKLEERREHLKHKKDELGDILKETEKEENDLLKKSTEFESKIDESLLISYKKIRSSVRNGLAVVAVERGASAGSFFTIPPQVQLDIASRKKFITDEHSGRILVDKDLAEEEKEKMAKLFTSI